MRHPTWLVLIAGLGACSQPQPRELPGPLVLSRETEQTHSAASKAPSHFDGLEALVAAAQIQNPGLASARAAWEAAQARIAQAQGYPDPTVGIGGFLTPLETRNGPTQARLSLQQRLPWPSELDAAEDRATAAAAASFERLLDQGLEVEYQVRKAWWELAYIHLALDLVRQTLELVVTTENSLHAKLEVGHATYGDLVRIEVERDRLEDQIRSFEDRLNPLRHQIRSLLGDAGEEPRWPQPLLTPDQVPPAPDSIPRAPHPRHPALLEFAYLQVASQAELELARKQSWPDLMVGLEWTMIGDGPAIAPDSGQDALAASINLSLPVHTYRYAGARREARSHITQFAEAQRNTELQLRSGLSEAGFQFRDAERRIRLFRDELEPKTEKAFEAALSALESGEANFETLLDTLRLLLEFQVSAARAEADRAQALAWIERLHGTASLPKEQSMNEADMEDEN